MPNTVSTVGVKSIKRVGTADVYNLDVEDTHNFIANGIVIHNCIDATRYSLEKYWRKRGN